MRKPIILSGITSSLLFGSLTMEMPTVVSYGGDSSSSSYTMSSSVGSHLIGFESNESQYVHYSLGVYSDVESFNEAPTVSVSSVLHLNEDYSKSFSATVSDPENDTITTTVIQQPSYGSISVSGMVFTYTPNSDYSGLDSIKLSFDDGYSGVVEKTVTFVVNAVDDDPILDVFSSKTVDEDSSAISIPVSLTDIDSEVSTATYTVEFSDSSLATAEVSNGNLMVTPIENMFGSTEITVNATLDGKTVSQKFNYTLNPVDDEPVLEPLEAKTVLEDSETIEIPLTVSDIDSDISSTIYTLENSNPDIATAEIVENSLKVTPIENQYGEAEITVTVTLDGKTVSQIFNYTLSPVDDTPLLKPIENLSSSGESSEIDLNLSDIDSDINGATYEVVSSNPDIATATIENGKLVITPKADGKVDFTVNASLDGQTVSQNFQYSVEFPVESDLSIDRVDDLELEVSEDSVVETIYFTVNSVLEITDISAVSSSDEIKVSVVDDSIEIEIPAGFIGKATAILTATDKSGAEATERFNITVSPSEEQVCLASSSESLSFETIRNENEDQNYIRSSLNLVEFLESCETSLPVSWWSSNEEVIDVVGNVYIDSEKDYTIQLIATVDETVQKKFLLTVPKDELTDEIAVQQGLDSITFDSIRGENSRRSEINSNLNLYSESVSNTVVSWESNSEALLFDGTVYRGDSDTPVLLTATVSKNGESAIKEFNLIIKAEKYLDSDIIDADKVWLSLSNILGENRSVTAVKTDLELHTSGMNGSDILWETSDSSVVKTDGTVQRDPLIDRYIELKATLQSGDISDEKEFLLKVLKSLSFETASDLTFDRVEEIQSEDSQVISIVLQDSDSETVTSTVEVSKELEDRSETIVTDESVQTTVENENSLTTIYLNSDGSAETKVETVDESGNSVETRLNLQISGGTTEVQDDGSIVTETENSSVVVNSDGSTQHSVGSSTATSKLAGSSVEVSDSGVKTSYETVSGGIILTATIDTDSEAKSKTSFSITDIDSGESIELDGTLSGESSFDENSTFEIDKSEDGELQIKIGTTISDILEIK